MTNGSNEDGEDPDDLEEDDDVTAVMWLLILQLLTKVK